jgi:alkylation response protein AidB-like acyl-CoA dehydrogenase
MANAVEAAREIADEVLFPAALDVDGADRIPDSHFDALAAAGFYGISAPVAVGGMDADFAAFGAVTEVLAGACLATTFVWHQHVGAVRAVAASGSDFAAGIVGAMCRGELRAGVALAGVRPGEPLLRATPSGGGWRLDGTAPWVTGWGMVDMLHVLARGPGNTVVSLLLDAVDYAGLSARRLHLVAVHASRTVELAFDAVEVAAERHLGTTPFAPGNPAPVLRVHAMLALGLIGRCRALLGPSPLDEELAAVRAALDEALADETADRMYAARAAAAELAVRAAAATVVAAGSASITRDQHPQRLVREAAFLLVFGSRPQVRTALLHRLRHG